MLLIFILERQIRLYTKTVFGDTPEEALNDQLK